jgi:hypothetical protein
VSVRVGASFFCFLLFFDWRAEVADRFISSSLFFFLYLHFETLAAQPPAGATLYMYIYKTKEKNIMTDSSEKRVAQLEQRLEALVEKAERVQSGVAVFHRTDGSTVAIPRLKRAGGRKALTEDEWDARIGRAVAELESHGVAPSTKNLMSLSIGRHALTAFRARAAACCVEPPVE